LGVEVVGLLGSTLEKGQAAAKSLSVLHAYGHFDELAADSSVDVVHICTPNYLHYPMAKAALEAGKHVVCEKPLVVNSLESAELVRLVRETGLVAAVNYNLRYYPLCHEARARVQAGEIGQVRLVHGGYLQDWLFLPTDWNWRLDPALGGELRAVADIGTHWMDMVTWLTGLQVNTVMADLATFIPTRLKPRQPVDTFAGKMLTPEEIEEVQVQTEDYAAILFAFEGGARGVLLLSQVSAGRKNHFWWELSGSKASLSWDQERPNELWIGHRDRPNELIIKDPALMHADVRALAGYPGGHAEGYPDTFLQLYKAVYNYIAGGDFSQPPTFPTFEDGHHHMVLCEAIQQSAREGCWVEVSNQ
jgi:predicted dehydrogenase